MRSRRRLARGLTVALAAAGVLSFATASPAFNIDPKPPASGFTMNLNLGTSFMSTERGGHTWNTLAASALDRWNAIGIGPDPDRHFFAYTQNNVNDPCTPSGVNQVRFAELTFAGVCGDTFEGSVAVTLTFFTGLPNSPIGNRFEADVFVNSCYAFAAYPGPLRSGPAACDSAGSGILYDVYRVLLHEFGHVIGLDHPNDIGQNVSALMNSTVSDIDDVRPDDIAGARAINWHNPLPAMFVTNLYTTILGRSPAAIEVDGWVAFLRSNPTRADVIVHSFLQSSEFTTTRPLTLNSYVGVLYNTILLRPAGPSELAVWGPAVISRFNRLLPGFVGSAEFQGVLNSTPAATVIRRFYQNVLGRTASDGEVAGWIAAMQQGLSWQGVAEQFLGSAEYVSGARTFAQHIEVLYQTFLGRAPATPEVLAWVGALSAQLADVENAFIASPEFQTQIAALF